MDKTMRESSGNISFEYGKARAKVEVMREVETLRMEIPMTNDGWINIDDIQELLTFVVGKTRVNSVTRKELVDAANATAERWGLKE